MIRDFIIIRLKTLTYPIVTSEHEMIGAKAAIPVRVSVGNEIDVIFYCSSNRTKVTRLAQVNKLNHPGDTERKEKHMRFGRVFCPEV